ncbi:MAG TPA: sensor histidine kinase [Armatimonadota bacterium]|jgi:signal transduction histidine kinase
MGFGSRRVDIGDEAPLIEWRRKATDALTIVASVVYLPGLALWLAGHGPPAGWQVMALAVAGYLIVLAGALLRRIDHRPRVWAVVGVGYVLALIAGIAFPEGPFLRSLPISLSIAALALIGVRAGRVATLIGAVILMGGPFLRAVPAVARLLLNGPTRAPASSGLLLTQGLAMTGVLLIVMALLERFHGFLLQSLAAERRAASDLLDEMRERRRLEREIARTADEERCRLGQDVHDGVCQQITGALLRCQALERGLARNGTVSPDEVRALSGLLEEAIDEAHAVAKGLCPLGREPGALVSALRTLTNRAHKTSGLRCEFIASGDVKVGDPEAAHNLYRIAQEALSNSVKHARAQRIVLELRGTENELVLRVADDGAGLSAEQPTDGMGMRTMEYRAESMEGTLTVEAAPGGGTSVVCRVRRNGIPLPDVRPGDSRRDGHNGT